MQVCMFGKAWQVVIAEQNGKTRVRLAFHLEERAFGDGCSSLGLGLSLEVCTWPKPINAVILCELLVNWGGCEELATFYGTGRARCCCTADFWLADQRMDYKLSIPARNYSLWCVCCPDRECLAVEQKGEGLKGLGAD